MARAFSIALGFFSAAMSFLCTAGDLPANCGALPLVAQDQAICAARHYLQAKSELCAGITGFSFTAQATDSSWLVQVIPINWEGNRKCTGDRLEIEQQTGQLLEWKRVRYQPSEVERTNNLQSQ